MPVKLHQCSKFDIFYNMEILRPGEHPSKPDRFLLNELECWMYAKQCCVLCLFIQLSRNPQFVKDVAFSEVVCQNRRNQIQVVRDRRWHSNLTKSSKKNIKLAHCANSTRAQIQEQKENFWIKRPPALWSEKQTRHLQILITRSAATSSA